MIKSRKLALAGILAAAAIGSAAPAQAQSEENCEVRLDRLVAQFYDMADRRGYEEASDWWQARWQAYHESCVMH
jgi:hypothetical protein